MRFRMTGALTAWTLAFVIIGSLGCGGGGGEAPTASIESGGSDNAASPESANAAAGPANVTPEKTSPVTTSPPPSKSRYSQSPAAATTQETGNRYPSFVSSKSIDVVIATNKGDITLRLFPDKAPQTVNNFIRNYVETSFYENTIFHYADETMIVGGGFRQDHSEIPASHPVRSEAKNGLKNVRGTVAMGRLPDQIDSGTSHFFFNVQDNADFDHQGESAADYGYCVFGEVVQGMGILDAIAKSPTKDQGELVSVPVDTVVVKSVKAVR